MVRHGRLFTPLETLLDDQPGRALRLPSGLAKLYGTLKMAPPKSPPCVYSNFVTSLDGVVSLGIRGHLGGADISGHNDDDRMVMGLLRAVADVVLIGSGTLRADPDHLWTAAGICPEFAADYRLLRDTLGKPPAPLTVVVSGSGKVDLGLPVFSSGLVQGLVVTTNAGARELSRRRPRAFCTAEVLPVIGASLTPAAILRAINRLNVGCSILLEGGPHLLGEFYARRLIGEQFLTVSPQLFGRARADPRLSLVMNQLFSPGQGRQGRLVGAKRSASHLFLRYIFPVRE